MSYFQPELLWEDGGCIMPSFVMSNLIVSNNGLIIKYNLLEKSSKPGAGCLEPWL